MAWNSLRSLLLGILGVVAVLSLASYFRSPDKENPEEPLQESIVFSTPSLISSHILDEHEVVIGGRSRSNVGFINDSTFYYEVNDTLVCIFSTSGSLQKKITFDSSGIEEAIVKDAQKKFPRRVFDFAAASTIDLPRYDVTSVLFTQSTLNIILNVNSFYHNGDPNLITVEKYPVLLQYDEQLALSDIYPIGPPTEWSLNPDFNAAEILAIDANTIAFPTMVAREYLASQDSIPWLAVVDFKAKSPTVNYTAFVDSSTFRRNVYSEAGDLLLTRLKVFRDNPEVFGVRNSIYGLDSTPTLLSEILDPKKVNSDHGFASFSFTADSIVYYEDLRKVEGKFMLSLSKKNLLKDDQPEFFELKNVFSKGSFRSDKYLSIQEQGDNLVVNVYKLL